MSASPPDIDGEAGLTVYSTPGPRLGGRLRAAPEDFQVDEVLATDEIHAEKGPGLVPLYLVKKRGIDTPHVAREMGRLIKSDVSYAGLKDSGAVATQYMSAKSTRSDSPPLLRRGKFEARLLGFSRPISRGMLVGNRFSILVETKMEIGDAIERTFEACREGRVANFYGYQRFGLRSMVTHRAGKAIVERKFKEAVRLILAEPREGEKDQASDARRRAGEERYAEAAEMFTRSQDIERRVSFHLSKNAGDYLGAVRRVPLKIRRLLINSYQAYVFNLTMSRAVAGGLDLGRAERGDNWAEASGGGLGVGKVHGTKEEMTGHALPLVQLVGYAFRDYGSRFDRIIVEVLEKEGVSPIQFYIKEAQELSSEGGFRHAPLLASELAYSKEERGFRTQFSLGKGEYATILLREVTKPADPLGDGF